MNKLYLEKLRDGEYGDARAYYDVFIDEDLCMNFTAGGEDEGLIESFFDEGYFEDNMLTRHIVEAYDGIQVNLWVYNPREHDGDYIYEEHHLVTSPEQLPGILSRIKKIQHLYKIDLANVEAGVA